MTARTTGSLFLEFSRVKLLEQYWPRLRSAVQPLSDDQLWWRPNNASNSIANLLLHLDGNVGQWLVAPFNHLPDHRNRPAEFAERRLVPGSELLEKLGGTLQRASDTLCRLTDQDLLADYPIQGYTVSGLRAVYQVVEHFGMHYGQILYISKQLRGESLGFYRELDETGRLPEQSREPGEGST